MLNSIAMPPVNTRTITTTSSIPELDENDPRVPQEHVLSASRGRMKLKPHQLTLLHRCLKLERERIPVPNTVNTTGSGESYIRSRMGVLGDHTGSGKSFVALSLLMMPLENREPTVKSFGDGKVMLYRTPDSSRILRTAMIVFPHSITRQWDAYVRDNTCLRHVVVSRSCHMDTLQWDRLGELYDVLLVSNTFYVKAVDRLDALRYSLSRVVYDEIDSLNFPPGNRYADAQFYWFITASYKNFINPYSDALTASPATSLTSAQQVPRFVRYNFARSLFHSLFGERSSMQCMSVLIAKNRDSYVHQSMLLPPLEYAYVRCRTPPSISVLQGVVADSVLECLNACDDAAAALLLDSNRGTEESVIKRMVHTYERSLASYRSRLDCVPRIEYTTESERQSEQDRLERSCTEMQHKISCISERIQGSGVCNVCYEDLSGIGPDAQVLLKTISPCCSNAFCFPCISKWLHLRDNCPVCKHCLKQEDLMLINPDAQCASVQDSSSCSGTGLGARSGLNHALTPGDNLVPLFRHIQGGAWNNSNSSRVYVPGCAPCNHKHANLRSILRFLLKNNTNTSGQYTHNADHDPSRKVMVFSSHESVFARVEHILTEEGICAAYLRGNTSTVANVLRRYKEGHMLNVLLANTSNYGCGINLENTTDIVMFHKTDSERERQVIGRGNRMGRTSPLRVWYLLHDNEIPADVSI